MRTKAGFHPSPGYRLNLEHLSRSPLRTRHRTRIQQRLAAGVVDSAGTVVSGVVVVERVVVIAVVVTVAVSEENVEVREEERGAATVAGVVTVIVGVMENGAVVAAVEAVDAEDFPKVEMNPLFKHRVLMQKKRPTARCTGCLTHFGRQFFL